MPFIKKDPNKACGQYGSGWCCHDLHFDPSEILPNQAGPLCRNEDGNRSTTDRDAVNCKDCIEFLHS